MNEDMARGRPGLQDCERDCLSVLSANTIIVNLDQGCNGWTCAGTIARCGLTCAGGLSSSCISCLGSSYNRCKDCFTKQGNRIYPTACMTDW